MGLDQYWLLKQDDNEVEELFYHRKFNALENFMSEHWSAVTGQPPGEFNCQHLVVSDKLLDLLEAEARNRTLEPRAGFFFGSVDKDEFYDNDLKELLALIPKLRDLLKEGHTVVYTSWW